MSVNSIRHVAQLPNIRNPSPRFSWLALRRRRLTSCNVSSTQQHESSQTRASSTGDSLISGEVSYTGWTLSTGFGSESGHRGTCLHPLHIFALLCVQVFRCLQKMAPEYLSTYCQPVSGIWSSRLPTCETYFVRRTFICIRRPFKLELTSCSP